MKPKKLFIAVPIYGAPDPWFMRALLALGPSVSVPVRLRINTGDSLVTRARNVLTAAFLASDCTDLLFIDSDIVFTGADVDRIASHDELVVGGCYPMKQVGPVQWVANGFKGEASAPRADGLQRMAYVGTGFLRVNRWVFESMVARGVADPYTPDLGPENQGEPRVEHDFWSVGVYRYPDGSRRYLSEDWMFCQRYWDMGGDVWLDTRVRLQHMGTVAYPIEAPLPLTN